MEAYFHGHPAGKPCNDYCAPLDLSPPPRRRLHHRAWQAYTTRPRVMLAVNLAALVLGILVGQITSRL